MAEIESLVVLGAGTMGRGIAQLCAQRGLSVRLFDVSGDQLAAALEAVGGQLERMVQKGKLAADERERVLGRIAHGTELAPLCAGADLVIEAAPESMDLKVELLARVKALLDEGALLASNTSSLSLTELGRRIGAPERTIGLHFFNPPPVMPLLEVVRGLSTSDASVERALGFARRVGKEPIVVRDFPGFASSRLGVVIGAEAMRMLEAGVASAEDIDKAMTLGYGFPMGPLRLTDLVGLDVRLSIAEHLTRELGDRFEPPAILREKVARGELGKKTGQGFYAW